jgi:hypothetical protein
MADETEERCTACDVIFYAVATLTAALIGAIAFDYVTGGKLSEALSGLAPRLRRAPAELAEVLSMPEAGDADAGA